MTIKTAIKRVIRGIRDTVPSGYVLGRSSSGDGAVELIPWRELAQLLGQINSNTGGGSTVVGANPTATASDVAVNGSATTYMRSDAAPAVQKCSASVFGLCKVDGTTITQTGGVISAVTASGANPTATASDTAVNGTATTFMRSDAAPAIQKASSTVFGLCKTDGTTVKSTGGVLSVVIGGAVSPEYNPPPASAFTTLTNSVVLTDSVLGLGVASPGNGGNSLYAALFAMTAADHTMIAHIKQGQAIDFDTYAGIVFGNSGTGKFITLAVKNRSVVLSDQWTSSTVHNAVILTPGWNTTNFGAGVWLKAVYTQSTTTLALFASADGIHYTACGTDSSYLGTPDLWGVCVAGQSSVNAPTVCAVTSLTTT